jgi:raffinose/stachyose/melibiose transport system substrate-binding protein
MVLRTGLLSGLFAAAAFASVAPFASAGAEPVEIRITHSITGGTQKEVLDGIIADFEKANPEIKVKQVVFDDDQYSDTGLITQLKSDSPPDIYFQWAGFPMQRDAKEGFAKDITAEMNEGGWKDTFLPSVWSPSMGMLYEGKAYLVPMTLDVTNVIWFNKKIFAEDGVKAPATWDEFMTVVKTLAEKGETPIVVGNQELWPLGNWASHIASRVVEPAHYTAAFELNEPFNQPGFEKALTLIDDLRKAGAFNKDIAGLGADPAMSTFFQEAAAMHPIGSWLVPSANEMAEKDFDYGAFNTPLIDPANPTKDSVIGTATGFAVHAKSAHPKEAIAFLKFFTQLDNQVKWAEAGSFSPVKGAMDQAKLDDKTKQMADMLSSAGSLVPPPDTTYPVAVAESYYQAAAYVAGGEKSPKDALIWLDEHVKSMK